MVFNILGNSILSPIKENEKHTGFNSSPYEKF